MNRRTSRAQAKLLRFSAAAAPGASSVANTQLAAAFSKAGASSLAGEHTAVRLDWGASSCSASGDSTHGADVGAFAVCSAVAACTSSLGPLADSVVFLNGDAVVRSTASAVIADIAVPIAVANVRSADAAWTSSSGSLADSVVIPSGDAVVRSTASAVIADVAVPIAVANAVCSTPATAPQASTASSPSSAVMLFVGPASELLVVAKQLGAGLWAPSLTPSMGCGSTSSSAFTCGDVAVAPPTSVNASVSTSGVVLGHSSCECSWSAIVSRLLQVRRFLPLADSIEIRSVRHFGTPAGNNWAHVGNAVLVKLVPSGFAASSSCIAVGTAVVSTSVVTTLCALVQYSIPPGTRCRIGRIDEDGDWWAGAPALVHETSGQLLCFARDDIVLFQELVYAHGCSPAGVAIVDSIAASVHEAS
mmetsp:Transcript_128924/g.412125  ORF Transcript_128924/g.412125 Transcript_128924/m.412125 type:complete len:418 (+) Transcript_128924:118-1371(+)